MVLTREQIKEGNEKLAKILGWFQEETTAWYVIDDCAKYIAYSEHSNYPHKDLPFLRDWNYLMKVVDKIGTIVYHRDDDEPNYNWKEHYTYSDLFHHMWNRWMRIKQSKKGELNLMNDIESVWSACVAWCEYNESNKDE